MHRLRDLGRPFDVFRNFVHDDFARGCQCAQSLSETDGNVELELELKVGRAEKRWCSSDRWREPAHNIHSVPRQGTALGASYP